MPYHLLANFYVPGKVVIRRWLNKGSTRFIFISFVPTLAFENVIYAN